MKFLDTVEPTSLATAAFVVARRPNRRRTHHRLYQNAPRPTYRNNYFDNNDENENNENDTNINNPLLPSDYDPNVDSPFPSFPYEPPPGQDVLEDPNFNLELLSSEVGVQDLTAAGADAKQKIEQLYQERPIDKQMRAQGPQRPPKLTQEELQVIQDLETRRMTREQTKRELWERYRERLPGEVRLIRASTYAGLWWGFVFGLTYITLVDVDLQVVEPIVIPIGLSLSLGLLFRILSSFRGDLGDASRQVLGQFTLDWVGGLQNVLWKILDQVTLSAEMSLYRTQEETKAAPQIAARLARERWQVLKKFGKEVLKSLVTLPLYLFQFLMAYIRATGQDVVDEMKQIPEDVLDEVIFLLEDFVDVLKSVPALLWQALTEVGDELAWRFSEWQKEKYGPPPPKSPQESKRDRKRRERAERRRQQRNRDR